MKKKLQNYYIYALVHPETKEIKYVGMTINLESRYKDHYYISFKNEKSKWVKEIKERGLRPEMIVLEEIQTSDRNVALNREKYWISQYPNLVNMSNNSIEKKERKLMNIDQETYDKLENARRKYGLRSFGKTIIHLFELHQK